MAVLNNTKIEGFTSDVADNKQIASSPIKALAWGSLETADAGLSSTATPLTGKKYSNPTFSYSKNESSNEKNLS